MEARFRDHWFGGAAGWLWVLIQWRVRYEHGVAMLKILRLERDIAGAFKTLGAGRGGD